MAVQIATRHGSHVRRAHRADHQHPKVEDGIMVELGSKPGWVWRQASATLQFLRFAILLACSAGWMTSPRILKICSSTRKLWKVIDRTVATFEASYALSERLARICLRILWSGESAGGRMLHCLWRPPGGCSADHLPELWVRGYIGRNHLSQLQQKSTYSIPAYPG